MNYTLKKRKNVKNYRISIKSTGEVVLTVPLSVSDSEADAFIKKHMDWINKNLKRATDETIKDEVFDGGKVYILGYPYIIRAIIDSTTYVEMSDGFLDIHILKNDNKLLIDCYRDYMAKLTMDTYKNIMDHYLKLTNERINALKIKLLTSANGKCYFERKEIVLSSLLIHKKKEYIEAIALHEIAHLKHPNHQKEFYDYIDIYMKDYKERISLYNRE